MIDLYFAPTPNGLKARLFLEEAQIPYRIVPVRLSKGEQFRPEYLEISPNAKIPAIVDHAPADGGPPLSLFESGAILLYLAQKTGRLLPTDERGRAEASQWLFWQMSALGPMAGQIGHFNVFAPEPVPYAIERYARETRRLYGVLDRHLTDRDWIAGGFSQPAVAAAGASRPSVPSGASGALSGEFSIADIACYPWIVPHRGHGQNLSDFPNLKRWFEAIGARPATQRVYAGVEDVYSNPRTLTAEERQILFDAKTAAA